MDRVRLGRALGYGTRHAAKTVAAIAEAASAPGSAAGPATGPAAGSVNTRDVTPDLATALSTARPAARPAAAEKRAAVLTPRDVGHGVKHLKRSFWAPLATFSGALWLRVTGLFFALIAFAMGGGAWRLRAGIAWRSEPAEAHRFWVFAAFTALFGYFAISSFVRATLRERRAAMNSR